MISEGDSGAWLRSAMEVLILFGVPDEKYFPYLIDGKNVNPNWDCEPDSFLYAMAKNYATINYFSHDPFGKKGENKEVLKMSKNIWRQESLPCSDFSVFRLLKIPTL